MSPVGLLSCEMYAYIIDLDLLVELLYDGETKCKIFFILLIMSLHLFERLQSAMDRRLETVRIQPLEELGDCKHWWGT